MGLGPRSKQLAIGTAPAGTTTVYTVPSGHTTIIRSLIATNGNATAQAVLWKILGVAGSITLPPINFAVPQFGAVVIEQWIVLQPGDKLQVITTVGTVGFVASGAELVGVP